MAGRRVKRLTLSCRDFNDIFNLSGTGTNEALSVYLRGATHVSDVRVIEDPIKQDGNVVLFVESSTFPELGCCYKSSATEWTTVTLGEQRG